MACWITNPSPSQTPRLSTKNRVTTTAVRFQICLRATWITPQPASRTRGQPTLPGSTSNASPVDTRAPRVRNSPSGRASATPPVSRLAWSWGANSSHEPLPTLAHQETRIRVTAISPRPAKNARRVPRPRAPISNRYPGQKVAKASARTSSAPIIASAASRGRRWMIHHTPASPRAAYIGSRREEAAYRANSGWHRRTAPQNTSASRPPARRARSMARAMAARPQSMEVDLHTTSAWPTRRIRPALTR